MKKIILILIILLTLMSLAAASFANTCQGPDPLSISPASADRTALPNTVVTYDLTITNNSGAKQTITINATAGAAGWNTWATPNTLELEDKASGNVTISVAIKASAGLGDFDTTTVNATDGAGNSASATLTTRAAPPTATPVPTSTSIPTPTTSPALNRPLVMVAGYNFGDEVGSGDKFTLKVIFINKGKTEALNLSFVFSSDVFLMRNTGGVRTLDSLASGAKAKISQPMTANSTLSGQPAGNVMVKATYNDTSGETYTENFTLAINSKEPTDTPYSGGGGGYTAPTATQLPRSQLIVTGYQPSVDPLQPGTIFDLEIQIRNSGTIDARTVSMVIGGGATVESSPSGTPDPGSASGGNSDLANFAPLGTSNLLSLGDIPKGGSIKVKQHLIVNVTTTPGAYPLKLSFVYSDAKNNQYVDNQVITLLVYSLPQVEVVFYTDPGVLMVGQPNPLPIQVTNLGRKSIVLGSMKVTSNDAEVTNNIAQVGSIDAGDYFPLDAMAIPRSAGQVTLNVVINYNDDFNQLRTITQKLTVMAEESAGPDMMGTPGSGKMGEPGVGMEGMFPDSGQPAAESFSDKVVRLVKGLLGLDSAPAQPETSPMPGEMPSDDSAAPPIRGGGGGGVG